MPEEGMTLKTVQAMLKGEEESNAGEGVVFESAKSATAFLMLGLEIDKSCWPVRPRTRHQHHMPAVASLRNRNARDASAPEFSVDTAPLHLPSSFSPPSRSSVLPQSITEAETRIREAQAKDALNRLRHHLCMRSYMNRFKIKNITGQVQNTCARAIQHRVETKISAAVWEYHHVRAAFFAWKGPGAWETQLRELDPTTDVVAPNESALNQAEQREMERLEERGRHAEARMQDGAVKVGEGRRTLSWLWYAVPVTEDANDPQMHDVLRWSGRKPKRALEGDQSHVEAYQRWWLKREKERKELDEEVEEGVSAYARQHASEEREWGRMWTARWREGRVKAREAMVELGHIMGERLGASYSGEQRAPLDPSTAAIAATEAEAAAEAEANSITSANLHLSYTYSAAAFTSGANDGIDDDDEDND
ncbi:hypothetical protein OE88DRAFT_1739319 [Heliocybe sulcata]|uniref:Uncharacterized protein n=1 Tax=Heliocybe sulcata TaxID=5364 RepID=A0A5C3MMS5_9AGAM|nr:hypothetical protein OE88DRAFT_1739319 [Heliocybe sulcata]